MVLEKKQGSGLFSVDLIRQLLPEFELASGVTVNDPELIRELSAYRQFYGLPSVSCSKLDCRVGYIRCLEFKIVVQVFLPPSPVGSIWLFHGYFGHAGLFEHVVHWALSKNLVVMLYDLPGHGLSTGERGVIKSFIEYRKVLEGMLAQKCITELLPRPWYALGQSTGGGILVDYALTYQQKKHQKKPKECAWDKIVLLAPLVRVQNWRSIQISYHLGRFFKDFVPRTFSESSHDLEFMRFLEEEDPLQFSRVSVKWVGAMIRWAKRIESMEGVTISPLIVQGLQDETVAFEHNIGVLTEKFFNLSVQYLQKGRHQLVNESEEIRAQLFSAVDEFLF